MTGNPSFKLPLYGLTIHFTCVGGKPGADFQRYMYSPIDELEWILSLKLQD